MLNIIDFDLDEKIKKIVKEKDMAVVLSSLNEIVHGYYSTEKQKSLTSIDQIRYNNQDFTPTQIARTMSKLDYSDKLREMGLVPFSTFISAVPNKKGLDFRLLIAGDIEWESVMYIKDLLENRWKKNTADSMNLVFDKEFGTY